jgi:hypothetical protein
VYNSSYPLRPGPTCGQVNGPRVGRDPLHGVIQVIEVPLDGPAASHEMAEPPINYPGDPDNQIDWTERNLVGPGLEPAARACHDIVVHVEHRLAGGACAEQGQVWEVDENGIPDMANPMMVGGDDEVSSGGTGDIPGAIDFFHSVMFDNDGTVVNWVDESFGSGCPTMTTWQSRPWNPAGEPTRPAGCSSRTWTPGRSSASSMWGTFGPTRRPARTAPRTWGWRSWALRGTSWSTPGTRAVST